MEPNDQVFPFKQLEKFKMFTKSPGSDTQRSSLSWSTYRGNPRATVFTGVPNDGKGVLHAAMNPETFLIFLDLFEKIAKTEKEDKIKLECSTIVKTGDSKEKVHVSDLWFGKDAEGVMWISVVAENRPKIKFEFRISDFHKFTHGNGQPLTNSEGSCLQALACARALREVIIPHMADVKSNMGAEKKENPSGAKPKASSTESFRDLNF